MLGVAVDGHQVAHEAGAVALPLLLLLHTYCAAVAVPVTRRKTAVKPTVAVDVAAGELADIANQ